MPELALPRADGSIERFTLPEKSPVRPERARLNRVAYAAAHVVARDDEPSTIDWDATVRYREYLWDCNLAVAEAMDTAQRGMGLGWPQARELITRTLAASAGRADRRVACGCGTDQLTTSGHLTLDDIVRAYEEQMEAVEARDGQIVLMASRALCAVARSPADYRTVYDRLIGQARRPVILHWLGAMFDPALEGYWGHADAAQASEVVLSLISDHRSRVDGLKVSLLDDTRELALRRRLPPGVRMYTGDDFNFASLIAGDDQGYSDALLGIFDAIAPAASSALAALARGDLRRYHERLAPCVPLSRWIFAAPTRFYKTGIVFLAWLNGHQRHFTMLGQQQTSRPVTHLAEIFRLAAAAGLLRDPELAVQRMRLLCARVGIDA